MEPKTDGAVVVFSGGQDSTTCLAWALEQFDEVRAVTFDYGQRHEAELQAAENIVRKLGVAWSVVDLKGYGGVVRSALTDRSIAVAATGGQGGLPSTFTPCRNLVFLSVAAGYAISLGYNNLVTGVCQTDYSGYPDCRADFLDSLEETIMLANDMPSFNIHAPLMRMTKADTVRMAQELGALDLLGLSHTCYEGRRPACGHCPACLLRMKGFLEAGVQDPIPYEHGA